MIRRVIDFVFILVFVWVCMLLGLWIIDSLIVPLSLPLGSSREGLSNVTKAIISVALVLFWLWIWREIVKKIFRSALKQR